MRSFWRGDTRANTSVRSASGPSAASLTSSSSVPMTTRGSAIAHWAHTCRATAGSSPVMIFIATPSAARVATARPASASGGSSKARKPRSTSAVSSWRSYASCGARTWLATARTRIPRSARSLRDSQRGGARRFVEWKRATGIVVRRAAGKDRLGRSFRHEEPLGRTLDDHGGATKFGVEGNLVDLAPAAGHAAGALEQGVVERIVNPGGEARVERGQGECVVLRDTARIEYLGECDRAASERAGLVAAQHVDAAEVLDRREMLHDDALLRHSHGAARQGEGGDHRHELGDDADGECDGEEERLERIAPEHRC